MYGKSDIFDGLIIILIGSVWVPLAILFTLCCFKGYGNMSIIMFGAWGISLYAISVGLVKIAYAILLQFKGIKSYGFVIDNTFENTEGSEINYNKMNLCMLTKEKNYENYVSRLKFPIKVYPAGSFVSVLYLNDYVVVTDSVNINLIPDDFVDYVNSRYFYVFNEDKEDKCENNENL